MKLIAIRPTRDFASVAAIISAAGGDTDDIKLFHVGAVPLMPILLDEGGMPLDEANRFLRHVVLRSRSATGDTGRTYAEAMLVWLRFASKYGFAMCEATEERLAHFRNELANEVTPDGTPLYSPATVNNRVTVAQRFFIWGQKSGEMPTALGEFLRTREVEWGGWRGVKGGTRKSLDSLHISVMQRMPRVLSFEEISRLFTIARAPFTLMFRWGIATGLRRFEVCYLRRSALPTPEQIAASGMELVPIEIIRKGGKEVTVHAPAALVEETLWYCLTDRPDARSKKFDDLVFLSRQGTPYARGSVSRRFRGYADQIGSDATLHHLRHTFATLVLGLLESTERRGRPINSLKAVQVLLGHANVTTTEIYLRALEVSTDQVRDALDFLYGATL